MTSMQMDKEHWGEQRLAARRRRKGMIRGAMIAAALAFAVFAPKLVPAGAGAAQAKLIVSLLYIAVVLAGAGWLWLHSDEVERQRARNVFAAMGFASFVLTLVVMLAAPVFHLSNPTMIVWTIALIAGVVAYLVQRVRG